jgi:signal transduction histidine kinase
VKRLISYLTDPLEPISRQVIDYKDYIERGSLDSRTRMTSGGIAALILCWMTSIWFSTLWLLLVLINEFFALKIYQRYKRLGHVDRLNIYLSTTNTGYGTVAWCISTLYLSMNGGVGELMLGVCILIGVLTHATFNKISNVNAVLVTITPVALTILVVPIIIHQRELVDLKSTAALFLGFLTLIYYFISAARYNFSVRHQLNTTLVGLSEANSELEQHQQHLEELVDLRTRELNEEKIRLQHSLEKERDLKEMQTHFVSMASHEFRTPLAIIDGNARRIAQKAATTSPEATIERADTIRNAVARMIFLIERTLDSSRLAAGKITLSPSNFDIRAQIVDIAERQSALHPDHKIEMDLDDCPPLINADAKLIDAAISNVVSNALKYSNKDPVITISTRTNDHFIRIEVRDNGIGIPAKELPSVSSRFFRSSNAGGIPGTGIGLNLVRTLVEMHKGRLRIASEEGKWTRVAIDLPLIQQKKKVAAA